MEINWFYYSIAATLFLGISMVFYKMPAFKNYSPFLSTFWSNLLAWIMVFIFFFKPIFYNPFSVSWWGLLWGVLFAVTMILQKIVLKKIETNALFPITSGVGNIITIGIGIILLSESISVIQIFGMFAIFLSVFFFTRKKEDVPLTWDVIILCIGFITTSTISKYVQKLGAMHDTLWNFMVWQYLGAAVFALVSAFLIEKQTFRNTLDIKKYFTGSFLIGLFSFLGGWAIFEALARGPLSGVYSIHPAYTFVTALLGYFFFKENLTKRKIVLIALSILGVILIKIG